MLKISQDRSSNKVALLCLEGRVIGPWVAELQGACDHFLARSVPLALDVGAVSFLDMDGIALFRNLIDRQVTLLNPPAFLIEQLGQVS